MRAASSSILLSALFALALPLGTPAAEQAAPTRVRMSTALPEGTPAYDAWKKLEGAWREAAAGASELRIYGGGSGDEEMLRRLRAGQIQAAILTLDGAAQLEPGFAVLRTPLFVRSANELDAVLQAISPALEKRLAAEGYVLLGFAPIGWVRIFASRPVHTVADLQHAGIADWSAAADASAAAWWKARGYGFVPTPIADVAAALAAGRAAAVPATPSLALALNWYRSASHMVDAPLVPALGVAVIQASAWEALTPRARQSVRAAAAAIQVSLETAVPAEEALAVAEMEKRGLVVDRRNAAEEGAWAAEAARLQTAARGGLVDGALLDLAVAARDRARSGKH